MAQFNTSAYASRYAGSFMDWSIKVEDILTAMKEANSSTLVSWAVADTIHSALGYVMLERIQNRIGDGNLARDDMSYYEGLIDGLALVKILGKEERKALVGIRQEWWNRIKAKLDAGTTKENLETKGGEK